MGQAASTGRRAGVVCPRHSCHPCTSTGPVPACRLTGGRGAQLVDHAAQLAHVLPHAGPTELYVACQRGRGQAGATEQSAPCRRQACLPLPLFSPLPPHWSNANRSPCPRRSPPRGRPQAFLRVFPPPTVVKFWVHIETERVWVHPSTVHLRAEQVALVGLQRQGGRAVRGTKVGTKACVHGCMDTSSTAPPALLRPPCRPEGGIKCLQRCPP